jgi:hypothetical protein
MSAMTPVAQTGLLLSSLWILEASTRSTSPRVASVTTLIVSCKANNKSHNKQTKKTVFYEARFRADDGDDGDSDAVQAALLAHLLIEQTRARLVSNIYTARTVRGVTRTGRFGTFERSCSFVCEAVGGEQHAGTCCMRSHKHRNTKSRTQGCLTSFKHNIKTTSQAFQRRTLFQSPQSLQQGGFGGSDVVARIVRQPDLAQLRKVRQTVAGNRNVVLSDRRQNLHLSKHRVVTQNNSKHQQYLVPKRHQHNASHGRLLCVLMLWSERATI